MDIRILDRETIDWVYRTHMKKDFPRSELKPLSSIHALLDRGRYICFGLYEEEVFCAYAFLCLIGPGRPLLLDYLAVAEDRRAAGYGSAFMPLLAKKCYPYGGIMAEIEDVDFAQDEADRQTRVKRARFYERNNFVDTDLRVKVFSVNYMILYLDIDKKPLDYRQGMDALYQTLYPPKLYKAFVKYLN